MKQYTPTQTYIHTYIHTLVCTDADAISKGGNNR